MAITTYGKWSTRMDRWCFWKVDTDDLAADSNVFYLTSDQYQQNFSVSKDEEYFRRYGSRDLGQSRESLDTNTLTNPALLWNGETSDVAGGKLYSRPVPPSASAYVKDH